MLTPEQSSASLDSFAVAIVGESVGSRTTDRTETIFSVPRIVPRRGTGTFLGQVSSRVVVEANHVIVVVGGCIKHGWSALGLRNRLEVAPWVGAKALPVAEALPPAGGPRRRLALRRQDSAQSVIGKS